MPREQRRSSRAAGWLGSAVLGGRGLQPRSPRPVPAPRPREAVVPQSAEPAAGATTLGATPADPNRRLPHGMVKLLVQPARDGSGNLGYLLTGAAGDGSGLPPGRAPRLPPADIRLARLRRDGRGRHDRDDDGPGFPSEFYRAVRFWSGQQSELVRWLNALRDRHGDDLHLVVWDDTDFEIPWELLVLDRPDDGPGAAAGTPTGPGPVSHLGALVPVARWTTTCEEAAPLLAGPARCAGGVLGYFEEAMRGDTDEFRPFTHEPHDDPDTFLAALTAGDRTGDPLGLVYMGCHGTHGKGLENLKAGVLTWYELNERRMRALNGHSTAVVLNVCHSGRMVRNHGGGEDALRGFSELFLRHGATACIATRGEVGDTVARVMLSHLVDHTRSAPERPLALMLRDFRARAAAGLPDPLPRTERADRAVDVDAQRQVLQFLYAFMYVYYGHPRTTLRLSPRASDGAA